MSELITVSSAPAYPWTRLSEINSGDASANEKVVPSYMVESLESFKILFESERDFLLNEIGSVSEMDDEAKLRCINELIRRLPGFVRF